MIGSSLIGSSLASLERSGVRTRLVDFFLSFIIGLPISILDVYLGLLNSIYISSITSIVGSALFTSYSAINTINLGVKGSTLLLIISLREGSSSKFKSY